jgi:hypothetical protein
MQSKRRTVGDNEKPARPACPGVAVSWWKSAPSSSARAATRSARRAARAVGRSPDQGQDRQKHDDEDGDEHDRSRGEANDGGFARSGLRGGVGVSWSFIVAPRFCPLAKTPATTSPAYFSFGQNLTPSEADVGFRYALSESPLAGIPTNVRQFRRHNMRVFFPWFRRPGDFVRARATHL